jgi:hypothetical protein
MFDACPQCGGTAMLLETRTEYEEIHDLANPPAKIRFPVKVEEFRCQEPRCEHEFKRIIREPSDKFFHGE